MSEPTSQPNAVMEYVMQNKLKSILYTWGAGITGSLAYEWSKPTPASLKLLHARVYAQAITLAALGAVAAVELYAAEHNPETVKKEDKHGY